MPSPSEPPSAPSPALPGEWNWVETLREREGVLVARARRGEEEADGQGSSKAPPPRRPNRTPQEKAAAKAAQEKEDRETAAMLSASFTEIMEEGKNSQDVDDGFDKTQGALSQSINKVLQLAKSGSRYHLLILFLFALFVFIVLWWYI